MLKTGQTWQGKRKRWQGLPEIPTTRRTGPGGGPQGQTLPPEAKGVDRVNRLRIRSRLKPVHSVQYNLLLDVVYDGEFGTNFVLAYTVLHVNVFGRNLQKLVYAIENGMADFIQEFDPDRWEKPTDANAPIIESIVIRAIETEESKRETEH